MYNKKEKCIEGGVGIKTDAITNKYLKKLSKEALERDVEEGMKSIQGFSINNKKSEMQKLKI